MYDVMSITMREMSLDTGMAGEDLLQNFVNQIIIVWQKRPQIFKIMGGRLSGHVNHF